MDGFNREHRSASWLALLAAMASGPGPALCASNGPSAANMTATSPDRQAGTADRLAILADELERERERLASSTQRRAERLAARDATGVREAEGAISRSNANVAALLQELAAVSRQAAGGPVRSRPVMPDSPLLLPAKRGNAPSPPPGARWWDVYAHQRASPR